MYKVFVKVFTSICCKHGVTVHFSGEQSLKNVLVLPKDKDTVIKKNSVIYWYRCDKTYCDWEYKEESSRMFGERYKECLKAPSSVFDHQNNTGHTTAVGEL